MPGCAERQARQCGHSQPGRHQSLHGHEVVRSERDLRREAGQLALPDQVAAAALAAADPAPVRIPGQVRLVRQRPGITTWSLGHQVNRVVQDQPGPGAVLLAGGRARGHAVLVVPEHQRDIRVARPQHVQRFRRLGLGQAEVEARGFGLQPDGCGGHDRAERRRERGQPDPARAQAHVGRELILSRVEPAEDLLGPLSQQPPSVGEPDSAAGPLGEQRTSFGFQPGQVVADRGLRVVQCPRRGGHQPCRATATSTRSLVTSSIHSIDPLDLSASFPLADLSDLSSGVVDCSRVAGVIAGGWRPDQVDAPHLGASTGRPTSEYTGCGSGGRPGLVAGERHDGGQAVPGAGQPGQQGRGVMRGGVPTG